MVSIKTKIIIILNVITVSLVILMSSISYFAVKKNYLQQSTEHVRMLSSYMAASLNPSYLDFISNTNTQASTLYKNYLMTQVKQSGIENAFIFNKDLKILSFANYGISQTQLQLNRAEIALIKTGNSGASFPFSDYSGRWYIWGFYRINDNFYLGIEESAKRLETLNELSSNFILIGILGVLVTLIAGWFIAYNISKPVNKLVEFSEGIGAGNFNTPSPSKISGEFEILRNTMEKMKGDLANQNREREQMLAQIAHEIRNPLGGIELLTGLVLEDFEGKTETRNHLKKILQELAGLKNQLTLFLDFSKPLNPEMIESDVASVISEVKRNLNSSIDRSKIDFTVDVQNNSILFDYGHLKQILTNLVSNSIDVLQNGGSIKIESLANNGYSEISISDNGPGIARDNVTNIFNPFFTTKASGTGLGLAICKKLCIANNARMYFENNTSGGCTFKIQK